MKVRKAALLCTGLFACPPCAAGVDADGPLSDERHLLRGRRFASNVSSEAFTTTSTSTSSSQTPTSTSPSSSISSSSSALSLTSPLSVAGLTDIIVPSTTVTSSTAAHDGSPSQDTPIPPFASTISTLPSQQGPLSTSTVPSSSPESTTCNGQTGSTCSQGPPSSSSSSSSSSSAVETYSTPDGPISNTESRGEASSSRHGSPITNNTLSSNTFRTSTRCPHPTTTTGTGGASRRLPTRCTRPPPTSTVTLDCPVDGRQCYVVDNPKKAYGRQCSAAGVTAVPTVTVTKYCTPFADALQPMTIYSIVHTSTVTFLGNLSAYTPPYPTIKTPEYCLPSAPRLNSTSAKGSCSPPCTTDAAPTFGLGLPSPMPTGRRTITFVTTDKNPAVVFAWGRPSSSFQVATDPYPDAFTHETAGTAETAEIAGHIGIGPTTTTPNADSVRPPPTFRVTARGNQVVINGRTFPVGPGLTTVVAVDGGHFTIYPLAIVGEGATIPKPPPPPVEGWSIPTPTSGVVGGLDVSLSGTQMVIGGETVTMPLYGTKTVVIRGQSVTISWDRITVGTSVFTFTPSQPPPESNVVVAGGEMLTAIGKNVVVLRGTYITYGPGVPTRTEDVGGDGVVIGPSGVLIHGIVMGGPTARDNDTQLEIVGGATITEFAPNVALINGRTFTVGPGSPLKTTEMIAGQLFTIGPQGLVDSSLNLTYPFGEAVVTTIVPTGTWLSDFPRETNRTSDEDNLGSNPRSSMSRGGIALCIAIGVLLLT